MNTGQTLMVQTVISSSDLGQGSGALAWLAGDFLGRGLTVIAQPWAS